MRWRRWIGSWLYSLNMRSLRPTSGGQWRWSAGVPRGPGLGYRAGGHGQRTEAGDCQQCRRHSDEFERTDDN